MSGRQSYLDRVPDNYDQRPEVEVLSLSKLAEEGLPVAVCFRAMVQASGPLTVQQLAKLTNLSEKDAQRNMNILHREGHLDAVGGDAFTVSESGRKVFGFKNT